MKRTLLILFLFPLYVYPQKPQSGIALEINSNKKPIADVSVEIENAQPSFSSENGLFSFELIEKEKYHGKIPVKNVSKLNYIITNRDEVYERWIISKEADPWLHVIEVAHKDSVVSWKKKYKRQAELNAREEYKNELTQLKSKLGAEEISKNEYLIKAKELEENNKSLNEQLDNLAQRLAYINRDFAMSNVNKAIDAYCNGDIDNAIQYLNKINIEKELEFATQNNELTQRKKNQLVEATMLKARFYNTQLKPDSADIYYKIAISHDSTNYSNIVEYGLFTDKQLQDYKTAIEYYTLALSATNNKFNKADTENRIGLLKSKLGYSFDIVSRHYSTASDLLLKDTLPNKQQQLISTIFLNWGNLQKKLHFYNDAEETYLFAINSIKQKIGFGKADKLLLAAILAELGDLQIKMKKSNYAEKNLNNALMIYQSLIDNDPIVFYDDYINALLIKGRLTLEFNSIEMDETHINNTLNKCRACIELDSVKYLPILSGCLEIMGQCQMKKGNCGAADKCLAESLAIIENLANLATQNPNIYDSQLATTLKTYAILQYSLGEYQLAESYFNKSVNIIRDLAQYRPEEYNVPLINLLKEASVLYVENNQSQKAEGVLLESLYIGYFLKYNWIGNYDIEIFKAYERLSNFAIQNNKTEEIKIYLTEALRYCDSLLCDNQNNYIDKKENIVNKLSSLKRSKQRDEPDKKMDNTNVNNTVLSDCLGI